MKVQLSKSDVMEKRADGRGRVTLGSEYADKIVTVGVLEVADGNGRDHKEADPVTINGHEVKFAPDEGSHWCIECGKTSVLLDEFKDSDCVIPDPPR